MAVLANCAMLAAVNAVECTELVTEISGLVDCAAAITLPCAVPWDATAYPAVKHSRLEIDAARVGPGVASMPALGPASSNVRSSSRSSRNKRDLRGFDHPFFVTNCSFPWRLPSSPKTAAVALVGPTLGFQLLCAAKRTPAKKGASLARLDQPNKTDLPCRVRRRAGDIACRWRTAARCPIPWRGRRVRR